MTTLGSEIRLGPWEDTGEGAEVASGHAPLYLGGQPVGTGRVCVTRVPSLA